MTQLKNWTGSLITDLKALTERGNAGIAEYSKYLYVCRQEQSEWFGRAGKGKGREEEEEDIFADEKEWDPMEQFRHNREEWSVHEVPER